MLLKEERKKERERDLIEQGRLAEYDESWRSAKDVFWVLNFPDIIILLLFKLSNNTQTNYHSLYQY